MQTSIHKTDKYNMSKSNIENLETLKYQNLCYLSNFHPFKAEVFVKVGTGYGQNSGIFQIYCYLLGISLQYKKLLN